MINVHYTMIIKRFSILTAARTSFHLNLSQAAYIKTLSPVLCKQKKIVYTLKLFRQSRRFYLAFCFAFFDIPLVQNLFMAHFTIPTLSFACLDRLTSKLITLTHSRSGRDTATDKSVIKSLWFKQLFSKL